MVLRGGNCWKGFLMHWERLTSDGVVHHVCHQVDLVLVKLEARSCLPSNSGGKWGSSVADNESCGRQKNIDKANFESSKRCQEASDSSSLKTEESSKKRPKDLGDQDGSANGNKD